MTRPTSTRTRLSNALPLRRRGEAPRARLAGRVGALAMFLPSLALLVFALHQRSRLQEPMSPFEQPEAPRRLDPEMVVEGFEGVIEVGERGRVALRLEPLHPDPERQRFDAVALARALRPEALSRGGETRAAGPGGEGPAVDGEPWRLTLVATGEGVLVDRLANMAVEGLEPLVQPSRATAAGEVARGPLEAVADPHAALFAFPDVSLAGGETHHLVFWGPPPARSVALGVSLPGVDGPVALAPAARTGAPTTRAVAVLDAR